MCPDIYRLSGTQPSVPVSAGSPSRARRWQPVRAEPDSSDGRVAGIALLFPAHRRAAGRRGDWRSGSALRSHRRGHWFEPSIAHHRFCRSDAVFVSGALGRAQCQPNFVPFPARFPASDRRCGGHVEVVPRHPVRGRHGLAAAVRRQAGFIDNGGPTHQTRLARLWPHVTRQVRSPQMTSAAPSHWRSSSLSPIAPQRGFPARVGSLLRNMHAVLTYMGELCLRWARSPPASSGAWLLLAACTLVRGVFREVHSELVQLAVVGVRILVVVDAPVDEVERRRAVC